MSNTIKKSQLEALTKHEPKPELVVVVGNIGVVYSGKAKIEARQVFERYVEQSKGGRGRASGEDVTLFSGGEIEKEYFGAATEEGA